MITADCISGVNMLIHFICTHYIFSAFNKSVNVTAGEQIPVPVRSKARFAAALLQGLWVRFPLRATDSVLLRLLCAV